ncbi:MAG: hypothetical protein KGM24_12420, partial [Elusimicrobia bacterium]|nr:hypothetical protein [Elusimicrobiota bacterium]
MRGLLAAVLLALAALPARAASVSWTGAAAGDWDVGTNWSGGIVPGAADDVSIAGAFVVAYATDPVLAVNSLTLGAGATLAVSTGIAVSSYVEVQSGGVLQADAAVGLDAGDFDLRAGSSLSYAGAPAAPSPSLSLVVSGAFTLEAGATATVAGTGYAGGAH